MLEKLFRMVEDTHKGMCIMVEYYHVIDYVISIYKSPSLIEENKPLIRTEGSMESAVSEAYILLENYLYKIEEEQNNTTSMNIEVKEQTTGG